MTERHEELLASCYRSCLEMGVGFNTPTIIRYPFEKLLRERRRLCVVRVELSAPISGHFAELFRKRFDISGEPGRAGSGD